MNLTNNLTFTTKERQYLEDLKSHEEMCILKYSNYANLTNCSQLKSIFQQLSQKEQQHYNTINQLLNGQMPQMGQQSSGSGQQSQQQSQSQSSGMGMQSSSGSQSQMQSSSGQQTKGAQFGFNSTDKDLCTDMLSTEKYVSANYDTAIFEFTNPQVRQVLNHIQKEEQEHGETVFKYMESNGMYNPQ